MTAASSATAQLDGFEIRYSLAPNMLVFSHGFGVRWDSRGMFTDLVAHLPAGFGYVLFDYDEPESASVTRATYADKQVDRLRQAVAWAGRQQGVEKVGIVAHSRGCIIAAMAGIHPLTVVILLAPPLISGHARQYFTTKPGTFKNGDVWHVPRSDGTTTIIPAGVFEEFDTIQREEIVLDYAKRQRLYVVVAGADGVLGKQDFSAFANNPQVTIETIEGASHDFIDAARQPLIETVRKYLTESF